MSHRVEFRPSGRGKALCAPNPEYPNGIALDLTRPGVPTCLVVIPYPAPECGLWLVRCDECHLSIAVTAAGRPDDPISLKMECGERETVQ